MTFSVEFSDNGEADIVLLDPTGSDNDVVFSIIGDDVYIRQQCPETDKVDLILMHVSMLRDLVDAYHQEEGVYAS